MAGLVEEFEAFDRNLVDEFEAFDSQKPKPRAKRTAGDVAGDVAITATKAVIGLPQSFVGVADILTGGRVGKGLEDLGLDFNEAQKTLDSWKSEAQQQAEAEVHGAQGFIPTVKAALENPSVIATTVGESVPQMLGGAGVAKQLLTRGAGKVAPWLAGAAGEGVLGAGSAAEQLRSESSDGLLTGQQTVAAVGSGLGTAAFGAAGGKLAQKLKFGDVDTLLAQGGPDAAVAGELRKGFTRQVVESGISEGVFEELPQSVQEKMWQNWATGKPLMDGTGNAAGLGMLAGMAMGGPAGGYNALAGQVQDIEMQPAPPIQGVPDANGVITQPLPGSGTLQTGGMDATTGSLQQGRAGGGVDAGGGQGPGDAGHLSSGRSVSGDAAGSGPAADALRDQAKSDAPSIATAAEALRQANPITALDRVAEIDQTLASLQTPLGDDPDTEARRVDVAAQALDLTQEREAITKTWPTMAPGAPAPFSTEAGVRIEAQYAIIEADDLIASHDVNLRPVPLYPPELQPRERERAASEMQIASIVGKLDPARLGESADAANGAPIIGADGLVESGNARTIALKRIYGANGQKAADYRAFILNNASRFGLDPAHVGTMRAPVLVRVRQTPVNRAEFARQANASTVAQMSPSEQARADAKRIDSMEDLNPDENGDFMSGASRDFVRGFMARLPGTEQAGMIDAAGNLSQTGYTRLRNAVLAKAYGDSPVLLRMVESLDDNLRNTSKALLRAAPAVAKARAAIADGLLFDADITPDLMAAVEELSRIKDSGQSVQEALAQAGLLGEKYSPEARELIQFLAENARRPRVIAEFIQAYFEALTAQGNPNQGSLLGEATAPAKSDVMSAARRNTDATEDTGRRQPGEDQAPAQAAGGQPAPAQGDQGGAQGDEANRVDQQWDEALADLGAIVRDYASVTRMLPEDTPNLMPTLVKLMDAGMRKVGHDLKALMRYVREQLKVMPEFKGVWNRIPTDTYRKAAEQALREFKPGTDGQGDMFAAAEPPKQAGLAFDAPAPASTQADKARPLTKDGNILFIEATEAGVAEAFREVNAAAEEDERLAAILAGPEYGTHKPNVDVHNLVSPAEARERLSTWKEIARQQGKSGVNADRTVLSLFDLSGEWSKPWEEAGYNVVRFDLQSGQDINEFSADTLLEEFGNENVWAILAAPPCTDFASSGAQYWKQKDADGRTEASNELVRQVLRTVELFRPPIWAMENPVGRMAKLNNLPVPALTFNPNAYGDPYTKKTHIWGRFHASDMPVAPVEPTEGSKITTKLSGSNKNARSMTPEGFAYSFFVAANAARMAADARLAYEFPGISRDLIAPAMWKGKLGEEQIRSMIADDYYDHNLEAVRETLQVAAGDMNPNRELPVAERAPAPTQQAGNAKGDFITIDGLEYDLNAENYGFKRPPITLKDGDALLTETHTIPDEAVVIWNDMEMSRGAMRRILVDGYFRNAVPVTGRKPIAYVMGGGGASGKGTVKKKLRKQGLIQAADVVDLDPDELKFDIPEFHAIAAAGDSRGAAMVHEESSMLAKRIKKRAIEGKYDLILDVTLGDQTKGVQYLQELKDAGYEVRLYGVTVDPKTAVIRALQRAEHSRRFVPIKELLKAHRGFLSAFEQYAELADEARLYENTTDTHNIAEKSNGILEIRDATAYNEIAERRQLNEGAETLGEIGRLGQGNGRAHRQDGRQGPESAGTGQAGLAGRVGDDGQVGSKTGTGGLNDDAKPGSRNTQGEGARADAAIAGQGAVDQVPGRVGGRDDQQHGDAQYGNRQEAGVQQGDGLPEAGGDAQQRPAGGDRNRPVRTGVPAGRDIAAKSGRNYVFGDGDLTYQGSWIQKAEQNVSAVELVKQLETTGAQATQEEQSILAKFIGWGATDLANNLFGGKLDKQLELLRKYEIASKAMDEAGRDYLAPSGYRAVGYRRVWESGDPNFREAFDVAQSKDPGLQWTSELRITRDMLDKARPSGNVKKWAELRTRLQAVMSKEEWAAAEASTINAHYTSKPIVKSMWRAMERMGFKGGAILEPGAGIGVFPGLMPPAMAVNSSYTGIELDTITGGILKQLFPDERIAVESFVESALPDNFYDAAAGNPPFANIKILADPRYRKLALSLHDYFFAKTIDKVKPGGVVMFVTSRYTMDKLDDKARQYLADKADLVGAIRLPQTAFKQNAGTEVVTDVLFLRKKVDGETFAQAQAWGKSVPVTINGRDFPINEYFHAHPEMVLGQHSDTGKMANSPDPQYSVVPNAGDIEAQFDAAVDRLPADIYRATGEAALAAQVREIDFSPKAKKEGNYYVTDAGVLMQVEGGVGVRAEKIKPNQVALVKAYVPLRNAVKQAQYDQLNDGPWQESLAAMQKAYQAFVKAHGNLLQFTTRVSKTTDTVFNDETGVEDVVTDEVTKYTYTLQNLLADDPDSTLVMALEEVNEETGEIKTTPALTERVLAKPKVARIETPHDAMLSVLNDTGSVDMGLIAERMGMDEVDTVSALGTAVFKTPGGIWQTADEYLSGNVRKKLLEAQSAAKSDRSYQRNVDALMEAQPAPVGQSDISVALGVNYIQAETIQQFMAEVVGVGTQVFYNDKLGGWTVDRGETTTKKNRDTGKMDWVSKASEKDASLVDWGTNKVPAFKILEHALNSSPIRVTMWVGSGKDAKEVYDKDGTEAANEKVKKMRLAFKAWIWTDDKRANELVQVYNDKFNTMVARKFDGRHLTMPGSSALINVFDHVKRGAWRIVQDGNAYLAHSVGSGKTWQMVISAMEQKRLGLINKPMMVVPNHMLQQFKQEWLQLYPAARLMVADEKQFHTDNRRRFVARAAMSDLDGVIITHSAFKLLDLDPDFKRKMIEEELDMLRAALEEQGIDVDEKSRDPKVKEIQKRIQNYEQTLAKLTSGEGKDKSVRFDEMGVDFLYVDEAHEFRKLAFTTTRQVKGISSAGSGRAFDLWMKTRWLETKKPGRNLVMASGTPVTNTLAELYSVNKFMDHAALEERGLERFDDWAAMFGEEESQIEADASGSYSQVTRFARFVNVPELTQMFRQFADVVTGDQLAEMLGDKRPRVEGGTRSLIVTPMTAEYKRFNEDELKTRLKTSRDWKPSRDEPNNPDPIIKIIGDGRLAAIDMRFMDPSLPSDPDSKLNRLIDGVIKVYKETADWEYKDKAGNVEAVKGATQMVFSDLGFGAGVAATRGFNARAWFEKRLRDAGIPMAQVAFMSDYKKSVEKVNLFRDMNAGRVRIMVGSSKNMGTGVNAQQRLIAESHLDTPWYPADLEQREGRIIRQGNKNPVVRVFAYSAKGTYDQVMWQMLARKQKFIEQALSGDSSVRSLEDVSESSQYAMAVAMVAGDPDAINLAGARADIEKYERLQRHHEETRARMNANYRQAQALIEQSELILPEIEALAAKVQDLSGDKFTAKAGKQVFDSRKDWSAALLASLLARATHGKFSPEQVGSISGFPVNYHGRVTKNPKTGEVESFRVELSMTLGDEKVTLANGPDEDHVGMSMRATNALVALSRKPDAIRQAIADAKSRLVALAPRLNAPFEYAQALSDKIREAAEIEQRLLNKNNPAAHERLWGIEFVNATTMLSRHESQAAHALRLKRKWLDSEARARDFINADELAQQDPVLLGKLEALWVRNQPAQVMSRGSGKGIDMRDAKAMVGLYQATNRNAPPIVLLESTDQAPAALLEKIQAHGAAADVEGAWHEGSIYIFPGNIESVDRLGHVLGHEGRHFAFRMLSGAGMDALLLDIYQSNKRVQRAAKDKMEALALDSITEATEEALADMRVADMVQLTGWGKLVSALRLMGRKLVRALRRGGHMRTADWLQDRIDGWTDADVAAMLTRADEFVRSGNGGPGRGTMLSRAEDEFTATERRLGGVAAYNQAKAAGKTVLEYRQWVQVRTPSFKQWWGYDWELENNDGRTQAVVVGKDGGAGRGDSSRQDASVNRGRTIGGGIAEVHTGIAKGFPFVHPTTGEPRVFFHGTRDEFTQFDVAHPNKKDAGWLGRGHYVSSDQRIAQTYANIKNGPGVPHVMELFVRPINPFLASPNDKKIIRNYTPEQLTRFNARLRNYGHHGAATVFMDGMIELAAFDSNSLKSATDNTGAFSESNDIRLSRANPYQLAKAKAKQLTSAAVLDKILYEVQDKYIDLRRLRDHIKAIGGVITDLNDAYLGEELYHKRVAKRTEDFLEQEIKPLMADLRAAGISMEAFEQFLHARHAPEANAAMLKRNPNQAEIDAGRKQAAADVKALQLQLQSAKTHGTATRAIEQALAQAQGELYTWNHAQAFRGSEAERRSLSGMSDQNAAGVMAAIPAGKRQHYDSLAARVDAMNAKTLAALESYGLMDKDSLDAWRSAYQYYVPLHRDEAHPDSASHPIGQGFSTRGDAARKRVGSNAKVTHILGHIAMQRESALTRGEKNLVMKKLYLMAKQNPEPDYWVADKVPTIQTVDKASGFVMTMPDPQYQKLPNVLMLRLNGKDVAITFNEDNPQAFRLAQSMKSLDVDDLHYVIPFVGKGTRWLAAVNTQYNPIFGIINLMRDVQSGLLNLTTTPIANRQKEVMADTLAILKQVLKHGGRMPTTGPWATLFAEFQSVGGTTGYRDLYLAPEDRAKALLKELKSLDRGNVSKAAHAVVAWLSDYNEAMENSVRLAAYLAAKNNGLSKERAASLAKNLTVNFNRKGRQTREIGALYAFFNAALQGTKRMYDTLSGPAGKKIMAGGVLLGAVNAMVGMAMMGGDGDDDDDNWEQIPEFIKERALIIPISSKDFISIPLPLGFHFLPNIGRLAVEFALGGPDKTATKQMTSIASVLADAFNPLGGSASITQIVTPSVADPIAALLENKDWTGRPIYRENFSGLDPEPGHRLGMAGATVWSQKFAEAINAISGGTAYSPGRWSPTPDQIDYIIGTLTGGVGREAGKAAATVGSLVTGEELPAYKIPLVGRLYGNTEGQAGQGAKFYENIRNANIAENEIKGRAEDGEDVGLYLDANPEAANLAAMGNAYEKSVRELRQLRLQMVQQGVAREDVKAVDAQITDIMRAFNREVRQSEARQ